MKKFMPWFLVIVCIFAFTACNATHTDDSPCFYAEVMEIYDGSCLVKVTDYGNSKFKSQNVIVHDIENGPQYAVGDFLRIEFNGVFLETAPPQIKAAFSVRKTDSKGNILDLEQSEEASFRATVLEVHDTYLLVEPAVGTHERNSTNQITLPLQGKTSWPTPQVGDTVDVFYNGEIMETYPAMLGTVYRVEIVS